VRKGIVDPIVKYFESQLTEWKCPDFGYVLFLGYINDEDIA